MQVEKLSWDNSTRRGFTVGNNNLKVGKAVIKEYKSQHVLAPYSSKKEQPNQLNELTHCQKCLQPFKQPITLSCGFTLCYQCLPPSNEPYQCISFSCLRKHDNDYKPNILLENIMSHLHDMDAIKQLLDCSICLSPLSDPITSPCGHTFCKECWISTMTNRKTKSCPFCRHELLQIGKVSQILGGWIDYVNSHHHVTTTISTAHPQQRTAIIQVSCAVAFPSQHCLFHVNDDRHGLLREMTTRPHQQHYAICIFSKDNDLHEFYDYGIMVQVNHVEYSPDTRHAVVQAFGLFRLKINNLSTDQEGSYIGDVTRFDDACSSNNDVRQDAGDRVFALNVPNKRWGATTVITANNYKKVTRPRPCSMRLSRSAPNHTPSFNHIPGIINRRTWTSTMQFEGILKPHSAPAPAPAPAQAPNQSFFKQPTMTANNNNNTNLLFMQEIHPRLVQYLSSAANHVWNMQYDWYLQQSDQESIVWWIANVLPLDQYDKIHLLGLSTRQERLAAIYDWFRR